VIKGKSTIYFLFDATRDNLDSIETYYKFFESFFLNPNIILQIIAMRVSANPSLKMQALLTEVKNWAISYKIGFY
jgi:hypothetical protein